METYKIVHDNSALLQFIQWLPELNQNEKYYLSLFSRKKYCPDLIKSNDKTQLKRFLATKENMYNKIMQLELPVGRWKLRDMSAPQESLVLYIHPNPRNMKKATEMMGKKCWELMNNNNFNIHAEALSCIQKSASTKRFVTFDIDSKEADLDFLKTLNIEYRVIETRGGYHVLVTPSKKKIKSNWYQSITSHYIGFIDNTGDLMSPVPGCCQGNFIPKML